MFVDPEHITAMRKEIKAELNLAGSIHQSWLSDLEFEPSLERSQLPPVVKNVSMALFVKGCRQFRTVTELCGRFEAADAATVTRALFENYLTLHFVLEQSVKLPKKWEAWKRGPEPGVQLPYSREFRATLYAVHSALKVIRYWDTLEKTPGLEGVAKRARPEIDQDQLDEGLRYLASDWEKQIRNSNHSSGLSIASLTGFLGGGPQMWYTVFYAPQSSAVHATDARDFFTTDGSAGRGVWYSTLGETKACLRQAIGLFLSLTGVVMENIHSTPSALKSWKEFESEWKAMNVRDANANDEAAAGETK